MITRPFIQKKIPQILLACRSNLKATNGLSLYRSLVIAPANLSLKNFSDSPRKRESSTAKQLRNQIEQNNEQDFQSLRKQMLDEMQREGREIQKVMDVNMEHINKQVRVRFAPSPTGDLHIGGLRTALYNYLFAKVNDGKFILRVEDTDKVREVDGSIEGIVNNLNWAGLSFDEGPGSLTHTDNLKKLQFGEQVPQKYIEGSFAPYKQSDRLHIYKSFSDTLIENGHAYHCFCTSQRLKEMRVQQGQQKHAKTKYDRLCHGLSEDEVQERIESGEPYVIRMFVPRGKTEFKDMIHGKVIFDNDIIDDQVLIKADGCPTYHFANVVDDYLMRITHVIRGEEWLPSTPKHLILYKMFEIDPPEFAHLPLLLNLKGQKLSKRHGDVSVNEYRERGYLPDALLNGLALLGWNPPNREDPNVMSQDLTSIERSDMLLMSEMEALFNIKKVGKSGVKFDERKLEFLNSMHIRDKFTYYEDLDERQQCVNEFRQILMQTLDKSLIRRIRQCSDQNMLKIMDMMKQRIRFYDELKNHSYFFISPTYSDERANQFQKRLKQPVDVKIEILEDMTILFEKLKIENQGKNLTKENLNKICSLYLFENKDRIKKNEDVFFLLRWAVSGNPVGAPTGEICEVIGLEEVIDRCQNAQQYLKDNQSD